MALPSPPLPVYPPALRLRVNPSACGPDSLHPPSPLASPPTAVVRSLEAPSPVGSVPRACGFFPRPSRSHALVVCPPPPPAAEAKEEAHRGWDLRGGVLPPPPCGEDGEGGAVRVSLV